MPPISNSDSDPHRYPDSINFDSRDPPRASQDSDRRSVGFPSTPPATAPAPKPAPLPENSGKSSGLGSVMIPGYEILATIGRGAMGVVYQARQTSLNRVVALKVMLGGSHAGSEERARFRTEALTVAQVQHPNVIQIHDVGEHDGVPFLAVEYVGGGNLQQWLGGKPMSIGGAVRLLHSVARAVGAAHAKGIVHRDLKPANILLTADGVPKVADFGLAKQYGATNYTATGALIGTPQYMSPEQAAGLTKRVGPASDVYALGAILYQCLTGRPPFVSQSVIQLFDQIRFAEPVPVSELRHEVPAEVEVVCRRCLHKVPEERYHTAQPLADDLARILNRWEAEQARREAPPAGRAPERGWVLAVLCLIVTLLLWFFFARDMGWVPVGGKPPTPATPPTNHAGDPRQTATP